MTLKLSTFSKVHLESEAEVLFDDTSDLRRDILLLIGALEQSLDRRRGDRMDCYFRFILHEDAVDVLLWQAERVLERATSLARHIDELTSEVPA